MACAFVRDWDGCPLKAVTDSNDADVEIVFESVLDSLTEATVQTTRFEARAGQLLFKTRTIANFLAEGGDRVSIDLKPGVNKLALCNLLFGAVTGALLIQRGTLALHGCTVASPSGAAVFCGNSGAGKSTLTLLMLARGFQVLDDNIAALKRDNLQFLVQPGLGFIRLAEGTLRLLQFTPSGASYPTPSGTKYMHILPESGFGDYPQLLRHIYVLDRKMPNLVTPIKGQAKLDVLRQFTYMRGMVSGLGQTQNYFQQWLEVANTIPMSAIGHPPEDSTDLWADQIAQMLT